MVDDMEDSKRPKLYALDHDDEEAQELRENNGESSVEGRTRLVALELREWTDAQSLLARLESKLDASEEDVGRAVDYARQLEEECDRLAALLQKRDEQTARVRTELDEERGRRLELEEQHQFVVERLEELSGIRGRYHLERGRREQLEEDLSKRNEEFAQLQRHAERLTEALEEAKEQGFRAEIGPLKVELKR